MTEVVFLGTNGWYDTATGNTVCILIKSDRYNIILDAGNGLHKLDDFIDKSKDAYLFLSHFHLDHITGLHTLGKLKNIGRLNIFGPAGARRILDKFINVPFTLPLALLPFSVGLHELPAENALIPFPVKFKPLLHSTLTLGYRIELDNKIISYCPDTGYCDNAIILSKDADLLIAECAYKSGQENTKWPHLNPETAARIAKESNAKRLALVHFDASLYKTLNERKEAEKQAQGIFQNTFASEDGWKIEV